MLTYLLLISILLILGLFFSYYISIENLEYYYYFLYAFVCFVFSFVIGFLYSEIILNYFFEAISEPIILQDATQYTLQLIVFIYNYTCLIILPVILLFILLFFLQITYRFKHLVYKLSSLLVIYYLCIVFWIIKYDIFFSNWFVFSYIPILPLLLDFQPNLEHLLPFFWIDFWEIVWVVFVLHVIFINILMNTRYLNTWDLSGDDLFLVIYLSAFGIIYYLFSELIFWNDFSLLLHCIFIVVCTELFCYATYYLKLYKYKKLIY